MDGLPLGHRNLSLSSEYDYHHAMAQHAAGIVNAANNSSIHPAMAAQLSMLPAGLNLSVNSANQGMSLANSNTSHLTHHIGGMGGSCSGGGGGGSHSHKKHKKPKVNKDGVPAPKRATTAYINFTQWYREELKKAGRQIPRIGDFGKECAGKWNQMGGEKKEPFLAAAAKDKERYRREMEIYKPARDVNKPKRPGTAFMLFMADFRKEMAGKEPEGGVAALAKLGGERWRGMTEEDKRPYVEKQNEEKIRYEGCMEEYRRKQSIECMPPAKQPRLEEASQSQDSSDSQENAGGQHSPGPASGCSTPASLSSSPPAQATSPGASSSGSTGGNNNNNSQTQPASTTSTTPSSISLPSLSSMSLPHTLAMGYNQHSLPNFAHTGSILSTSSSYNQAHTTLPSATPYNLTSGATYTQAHLPGHYSWT